MPGPDRKADRMRIGMFLSYAGGFAETVVELADYEKAGLDIVFVPEAYSFDAVSQLGFMAAKTERLQIASGILPLYSRTPALTAMTAAGPLWDTAFPWIRRGPRCTRTCRLRTTSARSV